VPGEHGAEERRQGHGPTGPGGLGLVEHQATGGGLHGPANLGHREVRIQVRPPKGQDLAPAHPGAQGHGGGDLHVGPGKQAQDPPGHGGVHHHLLGADGPRGPGPTGRVGPQELPPHGLPQGLGEDQVQVKHRPGGQTPLPFGVPEGTLQAVIALALIMIFAIAALYLQGTFRGTEGTLRDLTEEQVAAIPSTEIIGRISRFDVTRLGPDGEEITLRNIPEPQADAIPLDQIIEKTPTGRSDVTRRIPVDADAKDFSNQLLTILGTLVGAVAGFYFGAKSVEAGVAAGGGTVSPTNTPPPSSAAFPTSGRPFGLKWADGRARRPRTMGTNGSAKIHEGRTGTT
jgi:hypothetical protein